MWNPGLGFGGDSWFYDNSVLKPWGNRMSKHKVLWSVRSSWVIKKGINVLRVQSISEWKCCRFWEEMMTEATTETKIDDLGEIGKVEKPAEPQTLWPDPPLG